MSMPNSRFNSARAKCSSRRGFSPPEASQFFSRRRRSRLSNRAILADAGMSLGSWGAHVADDVGGRFGPAAPGSDAGVANLSGAVMREWRSFIWHVKRMEQQIDDRGNTPKGYVGERRRPARLNPQRGNDAGWTIGHPDGVGGAVLFRSAPRATSLVRRRRRHSDLASRASRAD